MHFVGDNAQEKEAAFWKEAAATAHAQFARPRRYLVGLSIVISAEIEVEAASPEQARLLAERSPEGATRTMKTQPYGTRLAIQRRKDPKNHESELEWVEIEERPIDPLNPDSPRIWAERK